VSGSWVAWTVAVLAGTGAAAGLHMSLRSHRRAGGIRYLLPGLVAVWVLLPWRIAEDSGNFAPAIIVLLFRGLFEPDGDPAGVAAGLLLATAVVLVLYFIVIGTAFALRKRPPVDPG